MLKQELNLKLQQKLSPMQIQVIKMLEYPTIEMEERIREEMEINPALEEGKDDLSDNLDELEAERMHTDEEGNELSREDFEITEYASDDDIPDYKLFTNNVSPGEPFPETIPLSSGISFHEHLSSQLELIEVPTEKRQLAEYLIGNIDDDGYLRRSVESMVDDLAFQVGLLISEEEMFEALYVVQSLDPAGVGAQTLQECLLLQLERKNQTKNIKLASRIISKMFVQFTKKQFETIKNRLSLDNEQFREVLEEILKLNPKPGNAFSNGSETLSERIMPDFLIENENGRLIIHLNNLNIPDLRVSPAYNQMVQDFIGNKSNQNRENKDAILFAKQKIEAARWFIDAIKQRNSTLLSTMEAIVNAQAAFFLTGDEASLRPLKLQDIADVVGFDVSTISRVSNSKYVQTEFGIYALKFFFSETMMTSDGEKVSNKEIKQCIQSLIEEEDKSNPITDDVLTELLREQGYVIARRTVAKYREQLGISVARLRVKSI